MEKKKKLIITGVGITTILLIGGISIFIINIINAKKEMKKNENYIKENYEDLSNNVETYNKIRTDYTSMSKDFILDTYKNNYEKYANLMEQYNETIKKIDKSVANISQKCNLIYDNTEVNKICQNYDKLYEKLINIYITDLNNHNQIITKYNDYKNDTLELLEMIHEDYLDYNHDKEYEGRDVNEEN